MNQICNKMVYKRAYLHAKICTPPILWKSFAYENDMKCLHTSKRRSWQWFACSAQSSNHLNRHFLSYDSDFFLFLVFFTLMGNL